MSATQPHARPSPSDDLSSGLDELGALISFHVAGSVNGLHGSDLR